MVEQMDRPAKMNKNLKGCYCVTNDTAITSTYSIINSITEAELQECKAQIEELKQQLKDASSNNNFDQSLTYEDTKIKGNHTLTVAHLKGKVESEDIVAAGRAMRGTTQNATYRRVSMENHTVAGMVIEK